MIKNKDNFICPIHHIDLIWPQAHCFQCGQNYSLVPIKTSISNNEPITIYDFRQSDNNIEKDRKDLGAHLKILEGLYYFEDKKLKDLNFSYDISNMCFLDGGLKRRLKTRFKYYKETWQNIFNLAKFLFFKENSGKLKGIDSIDSSFLGYSKAYEMINFFVEPTWFGFYNRKPVLTGAIQHHYHNMKILRKIIDNWGGREILEFGLGSGINLMLLKRFLPRGQELKLSGFDYSIARLLTAKATFTKHTIECEDLFLANGLFLPLKDNSYDIVFSHYVIEQMKGFENKALDNMIRVAREGVVLFETAIYHPTIGQRIYMKHSGYSTDLPEIVKRRKDIEILEIRDVKKSYFFNCPNVLFVLRKK